MRRALTLVVPALVAAVTLAGCGTGSTASPSGATPSSTASPTASPAAKPFPGRSGRQILAASRDAADDARSVHLKGSGRDGGRKVTLDLHVQYGKAAYGTIDAGRGGPIQVRRVGKTLYIKASERFWRANGVPARAAMLIGGDWLKGSIRGRTMRNVMPLLSSSLIDDAIKADGRVSRVGGVTVGGNPTAGLRYRQEGAPAVVYVTTTGRAYPVKVVTTERGNRGSITFSQWNEPVRVSAPRNAFDFDRMTRGPRPAGCGCTA